MKTCNLLDVKHFPYTATLVLGNTVPMLFSVQVNGLKKLIEVCLVLQRRRNAGSASKRRRSHRS